MCTGYALIFSWNTGNSSLVYGLNQLSSNACPSSFADTHLLITPASSPTPSNTYVYDLYQAGQVGVQTAACQLSPSAACCAHSPGGWQFFFADPTYCSKGAANG